MPGGKTSWVEYYDTPCMLVKDNPQKGGAKSKQAVIVNGSEALRVGKVNKNFISKHNINKS